uniref:Uncharacterized protein n=1 Tax=Cryptomonas sp. CCAC 1634B TaxID=2051848 RepID=A0A679CA16_9CRYP|nr:hypothetical protein CryM1634B_p077 [Cryptomonas sp. CCAC 1634B]
MNSIDYREITLESLGATRIKLKLLSASILPNTDNAPEKRHICIQCLHIGYSMFLKTPVSSNVVGRLLQNYFKWVLWKHGTYMDSNKAALDNVYRTTIAISNLYNLSERK